MSCNSCKKSPCCCNGKRFRGNVDVKQVPGPQGEQGEQGEQGPAGNDGAPGAAGGMQFEHWVGLNIDQTWGEVEAVVAGSSHNVAGGDGNYQVHLHADTQVLQGNSGEIRLYVNGVNVAASPFNESSAPAPDVEDFKHMGLNWRGNVLNGQTIEARIVLTDTAIGLNPAVLRYLYMLINKEA